MEKPVEIKIHETREGIKQVIGSSGLNVSIIDMILKDIYGEVNNLAVSNLEQKITAYNKEQDEDGNSTGN